MDDGAKEIAHALARSIVRTGYQSGAEIGAANEAAIELLAKHAPKVLAEEQEAFRLWLRGTDYGWGSHG